MLTKKTPVLYHGGRFWQAARKNVAGSTSYAIKADYRLLLQILCNIHSKRAPAKHAAAKRYPEFAYCLTGITAVGVFVQPAVRGFADIVKAGLVAFEIF